MSSDYSGLYSGIPVNTSLLTKQLSISEPIPSSVTTQTGMLSTDDTITYRLRHFPDHYDIRPSSYLYRMMASFLGDAGVGQLRKRMTVSRLQATMSGTHFYDLDAFWGSVLGGRRMAAERLTVNPMTALLEQDAWDDVDAKDSSYRDRMFALAAAVGLGATRPGIEQAARAVLNADVELTEGWELIFATAGGEAANGAKTWDQVEGWFSTAPYYAEKATYDQLEQANLSWNDLEGKVSLITPGPSQDASLVSPNEIIIRIKKDYSPFPGETEYHAQQRRAEDLYSLTRVLDRIKPANSRLRFTDDYVAIHKEIGISNIVSESNFWEIIRKVTPTSLLTSALAERAYGTTAKHAVLEAPFSKSQGTYISQAGNIVVAKSYSFDSDNPLHAATKVVLNQDNDVVIDVSNKTVLFSADRAIADSEREQSAYAVLAGSMQADPYSSTRGA